MIKGYQRKTVVMRGGEESMFEYALFVLKNDEKYIQCKEEDMVAEAVRIIEENEKVKTASTKIKDQKIEKDRKKIIIPFSVGAAVGSAAGLIWLFI